MELALIDRPSKEEFALIIANASCVKDVVRALGYGTVSGSNSATVKKRINQEQLDTSHFKRKSAKTYTDEEVFCKDTEASQHTLRKRYKDRAYTSYSCAICGQIPIWQDKPLTLVLDHIDGNNRNGELTNLRWVCPNCNQQLPTIGFHGTKYRDPANTVRLPSALHQKHDKAKLESVNESKDSSRLSKRPEYNELIDLVFKNNFTQVGQMYGVSPNAVQKWLKFYKVPYTRKAFIYWYYINILQETPPVEKSLEKVKIEPKAVLQYTMTGELLCRHLSSSAASRSVFGDTIHANHISANCLNKRKSAYGYVWKFDI